MAFYILQEDGTSRLTLEDDSGFRLLEEQGGGLLIKMAGTSGLAGFGGGLVSKGGGLAG